MNGESAPEDGAFSILEFTDDRADLFLAINTEWIEAMFSMEPADRAILENPRASIIEPGGVILFVAHATLGVIGTCALRNAGAGSFELTKMGVRAAARGLKAGEFLLAAMIERARAMGVRRLYLLTNRKCAAAIHLYEKFGFVHDAETLAVDGSRYARCDVAMVFPGLAP